MGDLELGNRAFCNVVLDLGQRVNFVDELLGKRMFAVELRTQVVHGQKAFGNKEVDPSGAALCIKA